MHAATASSRLAYIRRLPMVGKTSPNTSQTRRNLDNLSIGHVVATIINAATLDVASVAAADVVSMVADATPIAASVAPTASNVMPTATIVMHTKQIIYIFFYKKSNWNISSQT